VLDDDGLAAPGEIIRHGDIYINKESPIETRGPLKSAAALADVSVVYSLNFNLLVFSWHGIIIPHLHFNFQKISALCPNIQRY
jgi:hypothetical protein